MFSPPTGSNILFPLAVLQQYAESEEIVKVLAADVVYAYLGSTAYCPISSLSAVSDTLYFRNTEGRSKLDLMIEPRSNYEAVDAGLDVLIRLILYSRLIVEMRISR